MIPGTRLGSYDITAQIGVGGMGEVYRATDTRLKREVAIKVLPASLASDPDRLARFQREAEVLASLNHPHIAAIYGLEESGRGGPADPPTLALVMELVEGPTLADRIAQGAIPVDDALAIARQIAEALEAAHEQGIVHRDLKPANIKVRPDGTVKVLDFGLAKAMEPTGAKAVSVSMSPTITTPAMTQAGMILGTAAYMSPEQARGRAADTRSDIWAFGCVLYEMLTGRRAFDAGETVSDAVAAILTREPDWSALPAVVPQSIRTLLRRCLQKDPQKRLPHIGVARLEVDDAGAAALDISGDAAPAARDTARWLKPLPWVVAVLAVGVAGWALWARPDAGVTADALVRRMELNLPEGVELFIASARTVAVSPDGSRVAFVGNLKGTRQIFVRPLDAFEASPLRGSEGATSCFFSPDGQSIGLVTASGTLKTISLADGLVTTVTGNVSFLLGSAWGPDGIVFVRSGALWQVPRAGGTARQLTTPGGATGETQHAWPNVLPDGKTVLFGVTSGDGPRIEALDLATGRRQVVVERGTLPLYAASGHLMFYRDGELMAARFDAARLQLTGPAVRGIVGLPAGDSGVPVVDASASGTVVYAPTTAVSRLVWVSRDGTEQSMNDTARSYSNPRMAPGGDRVVVQAGDLWIQDLARATFTRLSPRVGFPAGFPVWSRDGRLVIFRSSVGMRVQDADGSGRERVLAGTSEFDYPVSISPDGETLVFQRSSEETSFDVYTLPLRDPTKIRPLLKTAAYEGGPHLSPDGRWLTYISNESGQNEVYLRPYPGPDRRWPISTTGGTQAIWNPNGREIFYRNGDTMMAVDISTTPEVSLSPPRPLFEQRYAFGPGITVANYDVSRDGQRFLMVKDEATAGRLHVVMNWFADLTRRVPTASQ